MRDLKLYSPREVAEILGMNEDYIRQLARAKKIESIKIGRNVRFKEIFVKRFIDSNGDFSKGVVSNE